MKIIVVGAGKIGGTMAEQLVSEGHDVTVVDIDGEALDAVVEGMDVISVEGNGASRKTLVSAGAADADIVIAFTESDEINLLCCLIARKLGAGYTIARVRNPEYSEDLGLIREDLGLSRSINPEKIAAEEIARILEFAGAINAETFAKGRVEMLSFDATQSEALCGKTVREVFSSLHSKALMCAVERADEAFIPSGDFVVEKGDIVSVVAPFTDIKLFLKEVGVDSGSARSVMIIGGGKITSYLAAMLLAAGNVVKIIEIDEAVALRLAEDLPGASVICGDGSDPELLDEEGIRDFDALCTLTGLDEENILLSLYAKSLGTGIKTVTKVNQIMYRDIAKSLGLGSVISSKYVAANKMLRVVRAVHNGMGSNVETLYKIVSDKAEALEFRVGETSELIGIPLEKLKLRRGLLLACIIRKDSRTVMPHGKDCLEAGDSVIVVTTTSGLGDLDDILAE